MDIVIVKTVSELKQCLAIRDEVFVKEQGVPIELEHDSYDTLGACMHVLVRCNGKPAGTGRWIPYAERKAKIQRLAVLPEFRGQGVGRFLMKELERQARLAGLSSCILDAQCHAEAFYNRLGYSTVSDQPFEDAGIMHVRMSKTLY